MFNISPDNGWTELLEFVAAIAQPLIVIALTGLIGVWISFGKRLSSAASTADRALELAERTGQAVDGLNSSVTQLNETLHNIDIHNIRMEGRVADLHDEVSSLREAKHKINNSLQIHETKIALLEQRVK